MSSHISVSFVLTVKNALKKFAEIVAEAQTLFSAFMVLVVALKDRRDHCTPVLAEVVGNPSTP